MARIGLGFGCRPRTAAWVEGLERRQLLAAAPPDPAALLADINQTTKDSAPEPSAELGGQVLFSAATLETGRELWITTGGAGGAPSGARLFADALPGAASSSPVGVGAVASRAVFWAFDATGVRRAWGSDGTGTGTRQLLPGFSFTNGFAGNRFLIVGGRAYFTATDGDPTGPSPTGRAGIYSTDGTPEGTRLEVATPKVFDIAATGGAVYYSANADPFGTTGTLYRLDPGAAGGPAAAPVALTPDAVNASAPLFALGDTLLFNAGGHPWRSDGTAGGTRLVTDRQLTTSGSNVTRAVRLANGRIIFNAGGGGRLFTLNTDGSVTGPLTLQATIGAAIGNVVYLSGSDDNTNLPALWRTDGTNAGTSRLGTIPAPPPGRSAQQIERITAAGNRVVFRAFSTQGWELWGSDGTAAGTGLVKDINPGPLDSLPEAHYFPGGDFNDLHFFPSGGRAYFSAHSPEAGVELWASDGTTAGTGRVADVNASSNDSSPAEQLPPFSRMLENGVPFNGRTYFAADDGVHGRELWSTDGTAAGTRMEADLVPGAQPSDPTGLLVHENALWFVTVFNRIYKSDGTAAGTTQVSSTLGQVGVISREIKHPLFVYKGKVSFFGAGGDAAHPGAYLWATDGTPAGTVPMGNPITSDTRPTLEEPTVSGNYVYFRWSGGQGGWTSLYRHDGSEARLIDAGIHPYRLTDVNGTLVYSAEANDNATALLRGLRAVGPSGFAYKIPPVEGVRSIEKLGNVAYVTGWSYAAGNNYVLWRTDGSFSGTTEVTQLPQGSGDYMHEAGGRLWFYGGDGETGQEPWVSDGTAAGTHSLADLNPGPATSLPDGMLLPQYDPRWAAGPDGYVYFRAYRPDIGVELFRSDGTPGGTGLAADVVPGPTGSFPGPSMTAGGDLYFVADSVRYGREWWRVAEPAAPAARVVSRHVFYNGSTFDGGDLAAGPADDGAIAPDKAPLLAAQDAAPSFANVTSYHKGINGVMVDIANLPAGSALGADDFDFGAAGLPVSVTVRRGAGAGGSDRVTLVWRNYNPLDLSPLPQAVGNGWLTVTVKPGAHTGLAAADVFRFGNLVGEASGGSETLRVNALDLGAVKKALNSTATLASTADVNRDGRVNALDLGIVKRNLNATLATPAVAAAAAVAEPVLAPPLPLVREQEEVSPTRELLG